MADKPTHGYQMPDLGHAHPRLNRFELLRQGTRAMAKLSYVLILLGLWMGLSALAHAGTVTYVYTDPQGTPLAEADANGNITATFDYAPYGKQALGTAPNGPGYTGHVNDPDTGLVYMQARYYDPAMGRFPSMDPVEPTPGNVYSFNRYDYANNNPVVNIDPDGRQEEDGSQIEEDFARDREDGFLKPVFTTKPLDPIISEIEATRDKELLDPGSEARKFNDAVNKISKSNANGRSGKQGRLQELTDDPKSSASDRGWIKNERRQIRQGNRSTIRNPPGKDLAHERGREAAKGYSYEHSNLQDRELHRTQHKFDDFGRKNKERPMNDGN